MVSFGKRDFEYFIGFNDAKKIRHTYSFQKLMPLKEILIKLNLCVFDKR